jgi:hypothetical protein
MQAKIIIDQQDVEDALGKIGLDQQLLSEALQSGYLASASCTENDPPNYAGMSQWARTVRGLRERLVPLGWSKSDAKGYSTVVDPAGRIAIAVASGCENTGRNNGRSPTTKSEKGPRTADAVLANKDQLELFPETLLPIREDEEQEKLTYIYLFHRDRAEIRAELSLPASMGSDGHINGWAERIILAAQPLDPMPADVAPDFAPQPPVDVRRKDDVA